MMSGSVQVYVSFFIDSWQTDAAVWTIHSVTVVMMRVRVCTQEGVGGSIRSDRGTAEGDSV